MGSNTLIAHGGYIPGDADVTAAGTLILTVPNNCKYVAITNPSSVGVYVALYTDPANADNNTAEVGKGIYLAPEVGVLELSNVNMYYGKIWGITEAGTAHLCVQIGR
jgi:hypothetical protein